MELNATSEELVASPIYELELQLHEGITKKIEIESGQAFTLRCIDSTGTSFYSENLLWLHQGKRLRDSTIDKIKIKNTRKFSVLIVDFFDDSMSGLYECVLRRKDKVMKSRIHVKLKKTIQYVNLFDEELCTAEKQDFCTNGGTCLYHRPTGTYNCKCPPQYVGRMCEYLESLIISSRQNPALEPASLHRTQTILICSVMGIFFALACCCYFCYVKKSEKLSAQRNDRQTKSLESLFEALERYLLASQIRSVIGQNIPSQMKLCAFSSLKSKTNQSDQHQNLPTMKIIPLFKIMQMNKIVLPTGH
ncbi:Pro-neuregulin-2,membrane-bound isoform [Trichinella pseudospiralis]